MCGAHQLVQSARLEEISFISTTPIGIRLYNYGELVPISRIKGTLDFTPVHAIYRIQAASFLVISRVLFVKEGSSIDPKYVRVYSY